MEQRHNRKLHYNSKRFNPLEWAIYTPYLISSFLQRPSDFSGGSKITEHSHKVPGSTGSMNGVEGRGSSLYKIMVRMGYTSMEQ